MVTMVVVKTSALRFMSLTFQIAELSSQDRISLHVDANGNARVRIVQRDSRGRFAGWRWIEVPAVTEAFPICDS